MYLESQGVAGLPELPIAGVGAATLAAATDFFNKAIGTCVEADISNAAREIFNLKVVTNAVGSIPARMLDFVLSEKA